MEPVQVRQAEFFGQLTAVALIMYWLAGKLCPLRFLGIACPLRLFGVAPCCLQAALSGPYSWAPATLSTRSYMSVLRDGMLRGEFESRIMFVAPSELLIAQPVSSASQKLLGSYAQQSRGLKAETVQRDKYDKAAALQVVQDFYAGEATTIMLHLTGNKTLLVSDSCSLCCAGATEEAGALSAVEQLPPLVLQALAHALDYLQPLKMEGVLRMGATFRPFNEAHEMSLSPNALR